MFQSYLSPIQTDAEPGPESLSSIQFQSYLSPIQTRDGFENDRPDPRFNPILVQFKRMPRSSTHRSPASFQSYLSPIQTPSLRLIAAPAHTFQSYLSPIQTVLWRRASRREPEVSILS